MSYEYSQDNFWSGSPLYQGSLDAEFIDQGLFPEGVPIGSLIETPNSRDGLDSSSDVVAVPVPGWAQLRGNHQSIGDPPLSTSMPGRPNTCSRQTSQVSQTRRRPSAEAIARRRKQNRVSQAAWRARNKELVEELRQEIAEYSEYSQSMHQTMQGLLQTTEALKGVIVNALLSVPPKSSQETPRTSGRGEQLMSPGSSSDVPSLR